LSRFGEPAVDELNRARRLPARQRRRQQKSGLAPTLSCDPHL